MGVQVLSPVSSTVYQGGGSSLTCLFWFTNLHKPFLFILASFARFSSSSTLAFLTPSLHNHTLCSSQVTCPGFHWEFAAFPLVWPAGPSHAHTRVCKWSSKTPTRHKQHGQFSDLFMLNLHTKAQALAELHLLQRWEAARSSNFSHGYTGSLDWH